MLLLWSAVAVLVVVGVVVGLLAGGGGPDPAGLVQSALRTGRTQSSVHSVARQVGGDVTLLYRQDSTATGGQQVITGHGPGAPDIQLVIRLLDGRLYVRSNADGLVLLGFTRSTAAARAGRWLEFFPGDPVYQPVSSGITVSSSVGQIVLGPPWGSVDSTTGAGGPLWVVRGSAAPPASQTGGTTVSVPASLSVPQHGPALPQDYRYAGTAHGTAVSGSITFSDWGAAPPAATQVTPAGAIEVHSNRQGDRLGLAAGPPTTST
jgi:hypothetical protein